MNSLYSALIKHVSAVFVCLLALVQPFSLKAETLKTVNVELFWKHQFEFAGFYAAIDKGYYRDVGLKVNFVPYNAEDKYIENVLKGSVQFATSGTSIIKEFHKGKRLKLLANYFKSSPVAIATQESITSLKQLEGLTIHSPRKFLFQGGIGDMLNLLDVNPSLIKTQSTGDPFQLFKDNAVAAMAIFLSDQPYELSKRNIPFRVYNPNQFGMVTHDMNLFTSEKFALENPKLTADFTEATNKGWAYALANSEEIIDLILEKYNPQHKSETALQFEAQETKKLMLPQVHPIGSINKGKLQIISEKLLERGEVSQLRNLEQLTFVQEENSYHSEKLQNISSLDKLNLTSEQVEYLKHHPVIFVQNESDYPPFNYEVNGKPTGYSIDYISLLAQKLGIEVKFIQGKTWTEYVEMLKGKQLSAMLNIIDTPERRQHFSFTTPYTEATNVIVTRKSNNSRAITTTDLNGKTIALLDGYEINKAITSKLPNSTFVAFGKADEALRSVFSGDTDLYFSNAGAANYFIEKSFLTGLQMSSIPREMGISVSKDSIATHKDDIILRALLQKAMDDVSEHEHVALRAKWFSRATQVERQYNKGLDLTKEEVEYLNAHPVISVQSETDFPPFNYTVGQDMFGHSIDLINLLAKQLNIKVEFIKGKHWHQYISMLKANELDVMLNIMATPERSKYASFSTPYGHLRNYAVMRKSDPISILSQDTLNTKRIALVNNYANNEYLKASLPKSTFVLFDSTDQAINAISNRLSDVYFEAGSVANYYIEKNALQDLHLVQTPDRLELPDQALSFATNRSNTRLLAILQKAMAAVPENEKIALRRKWLGNSETQVAPEPTLALELTDEEKSFLSRHPTLKVQNESNYAPINFIDKEIPTGFSIDYAALLSQKLGVDIQFVSGYTWPEFITMLKTGELDMMINISPSDARREHFRFTDLVSSAYHSLVTTKDRRGELNSVASLKGKTVAAIDGYVSQQALAKHYPSITQVLVKDTKEALLMVATGKVDAFISASVTVDYHIAKNQLTNLSSTLLERETHIPVGLHHMAVEKKNLVLHSLLNKAINAISETELIPLRNKWFGNLPKPASSIVLTPDERNYIASSSPFVVCSSSTTETSQHLTLLNWLLEGQGIEFTLSPLVNFSDAINNLQNGTCDILPNATPTAERSKFFNFTPEYASLQRYLYTKNSQPYVHDYTKYIDEVFIVNRGNHVKEQLESLHENIKIKEPNNLVEGLELVKENKGFAFIGTHQVNSIVEQFKMNDIKIAGMLPKRFNDSVAFATSKKSPMLHSILSKAVNGKNYNEIQQYIEKIVPAGANKLQFSEKEQSFIAQSPNIRLCNIDASSATDSQIDLMEFITRDLGLTIQLSDVYTWNEALTALKEGNCDVLTDATETEERKQWLNFTPTYALEPQSILTLKSTEQLQPFSHYAMRTFAVTKGNSLIGNLKSTYPSIDIIEVESSADGAELVKNKTVLGFINTATQIDKLKRNRDNENTKINTQLRSHFNNKSALATRKTDEVLSSILSKTVSNVDKNQINTLLNAYTHPATDTLFTQNEKELINQRAIRVCTLENNAKSVGNLMELLTQDTGIQISTLRKYSLLEGLYGLENNECDLLPNIAETEGRKSNLAFSQPYYQVESVIVTSETQEFISNIEDYLDKEFIVLRGSLLSKKMLKAFPSINLTTSQTVLEALQAVKNGQAFAYIGNIAEIGNVINRFALTDIKISGAMPDKFDEQQSFATRTDDLVLLEIFEKLLKSADKNEIRKIMSSRYAVNYDSGIDYKLVAQVIGIAFIIILAIVIWNRRLSVFNKKMLILNSIAEKEKLAADNARLKFKNLLNSSGEGFLTFKADRLIQSEYSQACLKMFNQEQIAHKDIAELLYPLDCADKETFVKGISMLFATEDDLKTTFIVNLLPKKLRYLERTLNLKYIRRNEKIVLRIVDVTDNENLLRTIEKEQHLHSKVIYAITNKNDVVSIIDDFKSLKLDEHFKGSNCHAKFDSHAVRSLFRQVHTFKGLFLQIHFNDIAEVLHKLETSLNDYLNASADNKAQKMLAILDNNNSQTVLENEMLSIQHLLGDDFFSVGKKFELTNNQKVYLESRLETHLDIPQIKEAYDVISTLQDIPVNAWLLKHADAAKAQALKLNKPLHSVHVSGDNILLDPTLYNPFMQSLVHVFRNAVAHGLKTEEELEHQNYEQPNKMSCIVTANDDSFTIEIEDNGKGINRQELKQNLKASGKYTEEEIAKLSDEVLLNYIFDMGLSTDSEVTMDSGRGIGLPELKSQLERLDGCLKVQSNENKGTKFIFTVPLFKHNKMQNQ